jgi:hypothetical protein
MNIETDLPSRRAPGKAVTRPADRSVHAVASHSSREEPRRAFLFEASRVACSVMPASFLEGRHSRDSDISQPYRDRRDTARPKSL